MLLKTPWVISSIAVFGCLGCSGSTGEGGSFSEHGQVSQEVVFGDDSRVEHGALDFKRAQWARAVAAMFGSSERGVLFLDDTNRKQEHATVAAWRDAYPELAIRVDRRGHGYTELRRAR